MAKFFKPETEGAPFWKVDDNGTVLVWGGGTWYRQSIIAGGEAGLRAYYDRDGVTLTEIEESQVTG